MSGCTYADINAPKEFIFNTVAVQKDANSVYLAMSTMNGNQAANNLPVVKQFKSDRDRMKYLQGGFARNPNCCNAGARCTQ